MKLSAELHVLAGLAETIACHAKVSGFTPKAVLSVGTGALPRTTSSKLRRTLTTEMLAADAPRPLPIAEDQEA